MVISPRSLPGETFVSSDSGGGVEDRLETLEGGHRLQQAHRGVAQALEGGDKRAERAVEGDEGAGGKRRGHAGSPTSGGSRASRKSRGRTAPQTPT